MQNNFKTYSVKEAADMLGTSEFTIRRKIQNGQLQATIDSKKQGYRISEDSLKNFAKSQESKIGSIWRKSSPTVSASKVFIPSLGGIIQSLFSFLPFPLVVAGGVDIPAVKNAEPYDLNNINEPDVIDKFINRLKVELEDFDSQIQSLQFNISQSKNADEKSSCEQKISELQEKKIKLKKGIMDLEIHKSFLESNQHKKDTSDR